MKRKNGQFAKGQSGNPGGRPKGLQELQELARKHCPDAIAYAAELLAKGIHGLKHPELDESLLVDHKTILGAATFLRDTGMGRALNIADADGGRLEITIKSVAG